MDEVQIQVQYLKILSLHPVEHISDGLRQNCFIFIYYYKQCLNAVENNATIFIDAQNSILIGRKYLKRIKLKIKYDKKFTMAQIFFTAPHMTPGKILKNVQ